MAGLWSLQTTQNIQRKEDSGVKKKQKRTEQTVHGRNYAWSHSLDLFLNNPIEICYKIQIPCFCVCVWLWMYIIGVWCIFLTLLKKKLKLCCVVMEDSSYLFWTHSSLPQANYTYMYTHWRLKFPSRTKLSQSIWI